MLRIAKILALSGGLLSAAVTQAAVVDLTDGSWSRHDNSTSATQTFGANHVTLSAGGTHRLRFTGYDGGRDAACGSLACANDGVGINDDEVTFGSERLTARFSSAVTLNRVHFLDLFGAGPGGDPMAEGVGMLIEYAGGSTESLSAMGTDRNGAGYLDFAIGLSNIMSISFFTDADSGPSNSDFALAGLDLDWTDGRTDEYGQDGSGDESSWLNDARGPANLIVTAAQNVPAPTLPWLMLLGLLLIVLTGPRASAEPVPAP